MKWVGPSPDRTDNLGKGRAEFREVLAAAKGADDDDVLPSPPSSPDEPGFGQFFVWCKAGSVDDTRPEAVKKSMTDEWVKRQSEEGASKKIDRRRGKKKVAPAEEPLDLTTTTRPRRSTGRRSIAEKLADKNAADKAEESKRSSPSRVSKRRTVAETLTKDTKRRALSEEDGDVILE